MRQKFVGETTCAPPSLPPSLLHAPLGLLAALQNSARGHSGNHLFPAEHRAWGMQEARLTNLRGKVVVCQCTTCCEISPPPPALILICDVVHLTGEMKCCRRQQQPNNSARRECQISARCRDISLMKGLGNWSWCR